MICLDARLLCYLCFVALAGGCAFSREASIPIDSILLQRAAAPSETLIVFLPDPHEVSLDIVNEGFVEQARAQYRCGCDGV
jgi:hypothetical protein